MIPNTGRYGIKFAAFLLLLTSTSFAAQCVQNLYTTVLASEMGTLISISLGLTLFIIVVAYMLGTILNDARLNIFYKDELYHLFFSAVLIIGINTIFFISCQAFASFLDFTLSSQVLNAGGACYTGVQSPQEASLCYISGMKNTADGVVRELLRRQIGNEMDSTLAVAVYNPVTGGATLPLDAAKKTFAMQFEIVLMSFAMPSLISLTVQKIFVEFAIGITQWIIPTAFFFRTLPPTRSAGNILIAVSMALFIIIPVFYALNGAMDNVIKDSCARYSTLLDDQVMGTCTSQVSFWNIARLIPQAFFLPNLTIALTITFLSGINKALRVLT